jgi:hypothetical protein
MPPRLARIGLLPGPSTLRSVVTVLAIVLTLLPFHATAQISTDDLCYQVSWNLNTVKQSRTVRPVTKFPVGHALVNRNRCGKTFLAGESGR